MEFLNSKEVFFRGGSDTVFRGIFRQKPSGGHPYMRRQVDSSNGVGQAGFRQGVLEHAPTNWPLISIAGQEHP